DIPLLARHFIESHAQRLSRPRSLLSDRAVRALTAYDWPGNVRELQNVMERAVALSSGKEIGTDDLPRNVQLATTRPAPVISDLPPDGIDLEKLVADTEIRLIRQALEKARHNQTRAAKLLRLSPRTLRYRLQKYGLDAEQSTGS
ncbi:MAG: helix-turn-helix domain-containing protein, partial [Candidatus Hydrogenedentota bacterium]